MNNKNWIIKNKLKNIYKKLINIMNARFIFILSLIFIVLIELTNPFMCYGCIFDELNSSATNRISIFFKCICAFKSSYKYLP
jgi:hypothetical protein